jgi:hypothetical protein
MVNVFVPTLVGVPKIESYTELAKLGLSMSLKFSPDGMAKLVV